MTESIPVVRPLKVVPNPTYPGAVLVIIQCPFCGREHTHGGPSPDDYEGHRTAHCTTGRNQGYDIARDESDEGERDT